MFRIVTATFIILHGLVHLWYFSLSQGLVPFEPEMGWSGRSWLFSPLLGTGATRAVAGPLYLVATAAFVIAGAALFAQAEWVRPVLVAAALVSSGVIVLFWDGSLNMWVQKGMIGLLINVALLGAVWLVDAPSFAL